MTIINKTYYVFRDLSRAEKLALFEAWVDGKTIEMLVDVVNWNPVMPPSWAADVVYRVRPEAPSIDWSAVAPQFRFLALSKNGAGLLFQGRPYVYDADGWAGFIQTRGADAFASFRHGTLPWHESLVERPEGA